MVSVAFVSLLAGRSGMSLHVAHNRDALYTTTADGRVGNAFTLQLENRGREDRSYRIRIEEEASFDLVTGMNPLLVPAAGQVEARVFVVARSGTEPTAGQTVSFVLEPDGDPEAGLVRQARFLNPGGAEHGG